jgi:hypothetical protein
MAPGETLNHFPHRNEIMMLLPVVISSLLQCNTQRQCSFDAATTMEPNASMQPAAVCTRRNNRFQHSRNFAMHSHSPARTGRGGITSICAAIVKRLLALLTLLGFLATSPAGIQVVSMIAPVAAIAHDDEDAASGPASSSAMDDSLGGSGHADPVHILLTDGAWVGIIPAPFPPLGERTSPLVLLARPLGEWHFPTALYLLYHCLLC